VDAGALARMLTLILIVVIATEKSNDSGCRLKLAPERATVFHSSSSFFSVFVLQRSLAKPQVMLDIPLELRCLLVQFSPGRQGRKLS
jgi:hypothetical protein